MSRALSAPGHAVVRCMFARIDAARGGSASRSPEIALSAWDKRVSCPSGATNPQFSGVDHEKTPNFRNKSMVRAAPNRLFDVLSVTSHTKRTRRSAYGQGSSGG